MTNPRDPLPEIKPCPFCGEDPSLYRHIDALAGQGTIWVDCCATMKEHFILSEYKPKKSDSEKYATASLIKTWNKRT